MRQVNRDELVANLRYAIGQLPAAVRRDLAANDSIRTRKAAELAAGQLADVLGRYEVLSSAPLDHPFGDGLFTTADQRRDRDAG